MTDFERMVQLRSAVRLYVESKIRMTKCMQEHFRQLCSRCRLYTKCAIYNNYCNAWQKLQGVLEDE